MIENRAVLAAAALLASAGLSGCQTFRQAAVQATSNNFRTTLTGDREVGGGDPDGYATAQISVSDTLDQICWDVEDIRNLGPVVAAHIHHGVAGQNGPPVLKLTPDRSTGIWRGCADAPKPLGDELIRNPAAYYVNLHTEAYPNGAIRGQLGP
jgi:hypothetical protein